MSGETVYSKSEDSVSIKPFELSFKFPFRLAHGTRVSTSVVFINLRKAGVESWGEASLPPYLGTSSDEVADFFRNLPWSEILAAELSAALDLVGAAEPGMNAGKAAVDMALHELHAKLQGLSLADFLGTKTDAPIYTTYTLGRSEPEELVRKLAPAAPFKMIKLKLGGPDDLEALSAFRTISKKAFCADVNGGWPDREVAVLNAEALREAGAAFIEQPFPAGREEDVLWLRERVDVPIILDESVRRLGDLKGIESVCDGVNVKLMKSTGIREALQMIRALKTAGLKTVLGAMAESSCAVTAAAHIAGLADWVDLDGPLLIDNDPFTGVTYSDGRVILPQGCGAGTMRIG